LSSLSEEQVAKRIGLVVWWDVHAYSGVLAANAWAIARRLRRLLRFVGRREVRFLSFARESPDPGTEMNEFISQLLQLSFDHATHIQNPVARPLRVHLLIQSDDSNPAWNGFPPAVRKLQLQSAFAAIRGGWLVALDSPPYMTTDEYNQFLQRPLGRGVITEELTARAEAGAHHRYVRDGEVLSLREIVGQVGRSAPADLEIAHVALTVSHNPYVRYVLDRYSKSRSWPPVARRLCGAEGHSSILERHLLAALSEADATDGDLRRTFLWDLEAIRNVLERYKRIIVDRPLFVLADGKREPARLYRSIQRPRREFHPLDTVTTELIEIVDAAGGEVIRRVDKARASIQAYPGCVFVHAGNRYVIDRWQPSDPQIFCSQTNRDVVSWRVRTPGIASMASNRRAVEVTRSRRLSLERWPVTLSYRETITGWRELDLGQPGSPSRLEQFLLKPDPFPAVGLLLVLDPPDRVDVDALAPLCLAIRCMLPVHLGVEDDAIDALPVVDGYLESGARQVQVRGILLVDLYPQGIGLVDAIESDTAWQLALFAATRDWLSQIVDAEGPAPPSLLRCPLSVASFGTNHNVAKVLELLNDLLGTPETRSEARNG
jgi:hypothetical protein